jgi:hypothetical protein
MRLNRTAILFLTILCLFLAACSGTPPAAEKKAEPVKPPQPVTGLSAFYRMYGVARGWAPDAQVLQLRSLPLQEVKSEAGKAGAWEATFVTLSRGRSRVYTFSVVEAGGNLHKDVFAGPEDSYGGPSGQNQPFPASAVKIDSDKAYKIALEHGADYAKKNPNMPVMFQLEWTRRHRFPAWRVIWGESVSISGFSIFVDGGDGSYLETAR